MNSRPRRRISFSKKPTCFKCFSSHWESCALPAAILEPAPERAEFGGSLYRLLTAAGRPIDHAEAMLRPTIADRELARLLDVVPGTPLQYLRQVDFDESGDPVMVSDEWHETSVVELRVYRRGPGPVG